MKGVAITGDRAVKLGEFPRPSPQGKQVLIRTEAATICGSDLHFYRTVSSELGKRTSYIAGHEGSGVIEEIGFEVENVRIGDRVAIFHRYGCGHCEACQKGWPQYCNENQSNTIVMGQSSSPWTSSGTFAEYILAPSEVCFRIPDSINFESGSIIGCNGITAYSIISKLNVTPGEIVAVFGLGPLGLTAGIFLRKMGAFPVGVELSPERRALGEKLGFVATSESITKVLKENVLDSVKNKEVDVTIDFTGNSRAINDAVGIVKPLGRVGLVGIGPGLDSATISPRSFLERGVTLTGTLVGNLHQMYDLIRFVDRNEINLSNIVTNRYGLSDAQTAFRVADKGVEGKVSLVTNLTGERKKA